MNTPTLRAENLIEIGPVISEIWAGKVNSRGTFIQAGAFIRQDMAYSESKMQKSTNPAFYQHLELLM